MTWPTVPLGAVCDIVSGATPRSARPEYWDGDVAWVTPKDLSDLKRKHLDDTPRKITRAGFESCSAKMLPANSVLFSSRAPIGLVAINTVPVCTNQGFKSMVPQANRLSADYLYWWLRSNTAELQSLGRGATFKEVSKSIVERISIPLPPLPEQKRIAAVLDAVDVLRAKPRESLALLDKLVQSVFLDMFGDPVTNPKGWDVAPLSGLLSSIDSGWSPNCLTRSAAEDEWGVLKLGAVTWGRYDQDEQKALPSEIPPRKDKEIRVGDLLFTRKNTPELVAATAYVWETRKRLLMPDLVFRLEVKASVELDTIYLWQLLANPRKRRVIQGLATGAAGSMPNIAKTRLRKVEVPMPPIAVQREFAGIVEAAERQRKRVTAHLAELDALFASLQSRAFRGEL